MSTASGRAADLEELLRTLCRTPGPDTAALLGTPVASEFAEQFVRIEPTRFPSLHAIEMMPWSDEGFGVALPEPVDPASWSVAELTDLLGPLSAGPRVQGAGPQLQGFLDDPACPARAAVYLVLDGDGPLAAIEEIRIRVERRST